MTAFAAILSTAGSPSSQSATSAIAAALARVTGAPTACAPGGACTLLLSPLHPWDPSGPILSTRSCAIAAGQVMLEGGGDLSSIVEAYERAGARCTNGLSGEYAFAIWDQRARRLACARDGLGVRVAYVAEGRDIIVVTNALAAALAHPAIPRDLDERSLASFLASGTSAVAGRTPYKSVRLLPEGHTLTVTLGQPPSLERHWFFPQPAPRRATAARDVAAGYRAVLRDAVDDRIGRGRASIFLSGGIDSTTIAAAATDRTRLHAVTVEYRRTPQNRDPALARLAARRLSIPIDVVPGDRFEALDDDGDRAPALPVDEPTLADWRAMMRDASRHSTIGIHGEDGDALFTPPGGVELVRAQGAGRLLAASATYVARTNAMPYYGLRLRERLGITLRRDATVPKWLTPEARRLCAPAESAAILGMAPQSLPWHPTRSAMQNRLIRDVPNDFAITLAADVVRAPIEIRLPLMDSRVLAFVAAIAPIPWCQRKFLPRAAFRDELPVEIIGRRKTAVHGFYEALVESWRLVRLPESIADLRRSPLGEWVDVRAWADSVRGGEPLEVVTAWRVLLLHRWLKSCTR